MRFSIVRSVSFAIWHSVTPLVLGAILVASVLPIREMAAVLWLVILFLFIRDYIREGQRQFALVAFLIQAGVMSGVVTAATLAPIKITDRILAKAVTLPAREMTLAELDRYTEDHRYRHDAFPIMVWLFYVESDASKTVQFPEEEITLQHFLAAIESQTSLRRRFSGCGNGYTLLWGNDCSFGLSLRDPKTNRW